MARMARMVVPGVPHHVTHRGNLRAEAFLSDADRASYRELSGECAARFGLDVWAYCLASNHVHLNVMGRKQTSLSKAHGEDDAVRIRWGTYAGRPCGGEAIVRQMETLTVLCLALLKRGRKPKSVECVPKEDLFGDK